MIGRQSGLNASKPPTYVSTPDLRYDDQLDPALAKTILGVGHMALFHCLFFILAIDEVPTKQILL